MTYAKKRDRNSLEVIKEFRRLGCTVEDLGSVGKGVPDLLVGMEAYKFGPVSLLVEVKDGPKAKLTPDQTVWHSKWKGQVCIVRNLEDVRNLVKSYRRE
jgi:hypothetical protein